MDKTPWNQMLINKLSHESFIFQNELNSITVVTTTTNIITTTTTITIFAQFLIHCKYYDECGVCIYEDISTLLSHIADWEYLTLKKKKLLQCNNEYTPNLYSSLPSPHGITAPYWARASSLLRLHDHTQIYQTRWDFSRWVISLMQRLLLDNTQHSKTTSPVGFQPTIPASEQPQTHAFNCMATRIGE